MDKYYLGANILIEPLINQWPVTMPMNAPLPAAYFMQQQINIMTSYIESPDEHLLLASDPAFIGGNFMHYTENKVAEVKLLLEEALAIQPQLLELTSSIEQAYKLMEAMTGQSLNALYAKLPECLRGRVELVYDLHHRPSIRFIEYLFYNDLYYNRQLQSACLSLSSSDKRPLALSTAKLIGTTEVQLKLAFDSPKYDVLAQLREVPLPLSEIMELFPDMAVAKRDLFKSFFSTQAAYSQYTRPETKQVRIRYFGHACVLIEYLGLSILIDPFISYSYPSKLERYTIIDLPAKIDYVLITHGHLDHLVLETLLQIRYKVTHVLVPKASGMSIADPSLKLLLVNLGFKHVYEIDELEKIELSHDFSITSIPFLGEHHDLAVRGKNAYLIQVQQKKIYFGADSANLDNYLYQRLQQIIGDIDLAFIGMECDGAPLSWFYGPLLTKTISRIDNNSRQGSASDCNQAIELVKTFNCKAAYIYAMGLEPWLTYILGLEYTPDSKQLIEANKFVRWCNQNKIISKILYGKDEFIL